MESQTLGSILGFTRPRRSDWKSDHMASPRNLLGPYGAKCKSQTRPVYDCGMANHKYTSKRGIEVFSNTTLETNRPLEVGRVIVDPCTGERYRVHFITKEKETERAHPSLPDDILHQMG